MAVSVLFRDQFKTEEPVLPSFYFGIMRHSARFDLVEEKRKTLEIRDGGKTITALDQRRVKYAWPDYETRPWDPPIAEQAGTRLAIAAANAMLPRYDFDRIVCSPFRRCIQTAGIVARKLGIGEIIVDNRIGEVNSKIDKHTNFNDSKYISREDVKRHIPASATLQWDEIRPRNSPEGIMKCINEYTTRSGTLFVTHGDIVQNVVENLLNDATVVQAKSAGFVVIDKSSSARIIDRWMTDYLIDTDQSENTHYGAIILRPDDNDPFDELNPDWTVMYISEHLPGPFQQIDSFHSENLPSTPKYDAVFTSGYDSYRNDAVRALLTSEGTYHEFSSVEDDEEMVNKKIDAMKKYFQNCSYARFEVDDLARDEGYVYIGKGLV